MPRFGKNAVRALVLPAARLAVWRPNSAVPIVARPAGFQKAASPCPSRETAVCPKPTASAPTGNKRNSAPEFSVVGAAPPWAARRADSATASGRKGTPLERLRLIDQHDRDVVVDGVDQATRVTHEGFRRRRRAVLERAFALRADEDLEEFGGEAHATYPRRVSDGLWRRQRGRTLTCSSRKTLSPMRASIFSRAARPIALIIRPPAPMTMPCWLSRST